MPLLGLLAAMTVTTTVTVETPEGVRPAVHAVLYQVEPKPAAAPRERTPPLELRCTPSGVEPEVSVLVGSRRVVVLNDRAALTHVRIEQASGLVLLTATLVSRGQRTPQVRLRPGRVRITCRVEGASADGFVLALPHTRYAVSDEAGAVRFEADEGSRWRAWHPRLGRIDYTQTASASLSRPTF